MANLPAQIRERGEERSQHAEEIAQGSAAGLCAHGKRGEAGHDGPAASPSACGRGMTGSLVGPTGTKNPSSAFKVGDRQGPNPFSKSRQRRAKAVGKAPAA